MNELMKPVVEGEIATADDSALDVGGKSGGWLSRLQFFSAKSKPCLNEEIAANHYGVCRDQKIQDVGLSVDVLVVSARPKAMRFGEKIITCFEPKMDDKREATGLFKEIQDASASKDEAIKMKNMFGIEFLLWTPDHGFVTFFMATASARRTAPDLREKMKGMATLTGKKVVTTSFTWWTPDVKNCSATFSTLPTIGEIQAQAQKFVDEKSSEVVASEASTEDADVR